jgi:hypothetical protein
MNNGVRMDEKTAGETGKRDCYTHRRLYMLDVKGSVLSLLPYICAVLAVGIGASSSEFLMPCSAILTLSPFPIPPVAGPHVPKVELQPPLGRRRPGQRLVRPLLRGELHRRLAGAEIC